MALMAAIAWTYELRKFANIASSRIDNIYCFL